MEPKNPNFFFFASKIIDTDITEIIPNEPNQSSETYSTKRILAGKSNPVIIENTIRDSKKDFIQISLEKSQS